MWLCQSKIVMLSFCSEGAWLPHFFRHHYAVSSSATDCSTSSSTTIHSEQWLWPNGRLNGLTGCIMVRKSWIFIISCFDVDFTLKIYTCLFMLFWCWFSRRMNSRNWLAVICVVRLGTWPWTSDGEANRGTYCLLDWIFISGLSLMTAYSELYTLHGLTANVIC